MKKRTLLTTLICSLGLMAGAAVAKPGPQRMLAGLDLTETQKVQVKELFEANRAAAEASREERQSARAEHKAKMKELLSATPIDTDAVKALKAEGEAHRKAMADKRLEHKVALLNILTPEQREKFLARETRMKKGAMNGKQGKKGCKKGPNAQF